MSLSRRSSEGSAELTGSLSVPLRAHSYAVGAARVAQAALFVTETGAGPAKNTSLAEISLNLTFQSSRSGKFAKTSGRSDQSEWPRVQEQLASRESPSLASLLLVPATGAADLHFTLAPLLDSALENLGKKLVQAFPLCFNARWMTVSRSTEHQCYYASIAPS